MEMNQLAEKHLSANPIFWWGETNGGRLTARDCRQRQHIHEQVRCVFLLTSRFKEPRRGSMTIPKAFLGEGGGDREWIRH